jgi:ribosome biogenesis protein BRX1
MEAHLAKKESGQEESTSLVEIGPRFVLDPISIFRGSFGGQTLFLMSSVGYVSVVSIE